MYARFWHKVMRDLGLLNSDEPFLKLLTQGMVTLGGSAMSKSKGNVVAPDEIVGKYGVDTIRLFILFASPPEKQLDWSSEGVEGSWRFINRVWRLYDFVYSEKAPAKNPPRSKDQTEKDLLFTIHKTIKKVTNDIQKEQQLNTAISSIMTLVNEIYAVETRQCDEKVIESAFKTVVMLLTPFTPHLCEELWQKMGEKQSISATQWPEYNEKYLKQDTIELPVQINGRLRGKLSVSVDIKDDELKDIFSQEIKFKPFIDNKNIVKFIYVPNKILNVVVK
jgi:leucyl-tRNA synthetase